MDTKHLTAALIVTLAAGCNAQLGSGTYQGHASQEMAASPEEIMGGSWHDDGEWLVSPTLDAPDGATRVGVFLGQSEPGLMPRVQARALTGGVPSGDVQ